MSFIVPGPSLIILLAPLRYEHDRVAGENRVLGEATSIASPASVPVLSAWISLMKIGLAGPGCAAGGGGQRGEGREGRQKRMRFGGCFCGDHTFVTDARTSDPARTLVGAAAAGAAAAADPPPAPAPPDPSQRRFRLSAGEAIPDGMRRIAGAQLADAADELAAAGNADLGSAVHDARKGVKRVRAVLRLSREAIGEGVYRRENMQLRDIAARLATARDARVLIETLDGLEARFAADLPPDATSELRARLHDEHERALKAVAAEGVAEETSHALAEAGARTAEWTFERDDFAALEPSLRHIYRRGRKRLRAARAEPTAENLHDCRKRVKDLWHVAQLLRPAAPKRMKRLSRRAHELADLLGDHHDLSVLRDYVDVHPNHFEDPAARDALRTVIDRRRDQLSRRALKLGGGVYNRTAKRFVANVERGWRKRVEVS